MSGAGFVAFTVRGLPWAGDSEATLGVAIRENVRHSWPGPLAGWSWGTADFKIFRSTFKAKCGSHVRIATLHPFERDHSRACRRCSR